MYIIRADGNAQIGAGHLMRCLTIAEALAQLTGTKENITFLCADVSSARLAESRGFTAVNLNSDYKNMESELSFWKRTFDNTGKHVILVDSYYVTDYYLKTLKNYGYLFLLDDLQQRAYPVNAVINYNVFACEDIYRGFYPSYDTKLCIGSRFVPIRSQFLGKKYRVMEKVSDIMITTGGGDIDNIAGKLLQKIYQENYQYHLVTGRFNPHLENLKQLASRRKNLHIYHDVEDMAGLMCRCDLAVTAGGTTIYELAAIGVPFVCFSYAENQEQLTCYIGKQNAAGFAGEYHRNPLQVLETIGTLVNGLITDRDQREAYHERERQMIDGQGAKRLAEIMKEVSGRA